MAQQNNIAQQLNDLLVTRNFHPDMLDAQGKVCDSEDAKTFTFDYISGAGKNYGTMVIILDSDNDLKAFYGDNLGRSMEGDDKDEFFDFQQHLSQFANAHRWTYTAKDLGQLKHTMQGLAAIKEGLFEGYYGTRRISYAGEPTEARLMIRHNRNLGETDARFRYVESIFVETADGERYRLPFTNLAGGKAMLEHVRQGGKPYDVRGTHICEMITELKVLTRFNRASQGRVLEGIKQSVVEGAQTYYKTLRESIKRMASPRGYAAYFESWHPANITEQDQLVEDIKTLFVEQTIDDRIEQALPLLAKIQRGREMKEADIFENWANTLAKGTWSLPETPEQLNRLKELMAKDLIVGPDGTNATEQLHDLVGDDLLFDRISELAAQDARANLWDDSEVQARLQELGIQMPDRAEPDMSAEPQPEQGVAEGLTEMDKSQTPPGRDGGTQFSPGPKVSKKDREAVKRDPAKHLSDLFAREYDKKKQGVAEGHESKQEYHDRMHRIAVAFKDMTPAMHAKRKKIIPGWEDQYQEVLDYVKKNPNKQQGVASGSLNELKKSTVKSYADKKQAELDDVLPMPFKKPAMSKAEHEKAAKGMTGALARLSGQKPTSQGVAEGDNLQTFESLQRMRHLSGMPLKENVLNDNGSTLGHIIQTYQRDVRDFIQSGNMSDHLYDALYDYYFDDMPYGVKKARTGDPYEWIGDRFFNDLQGHPIVDECLGGIVGEAGAGAGQGNRGKPSGAMAYPVRTPNLVQTGEIPSPKITAIDLPDPLPMASINPAPVKGLDLTQGRPGRLDDYEQELEECNYTPLNEYCPVHGLKECWLEEMNQSILDTGSRLIEDLDEDMTDVGDVVGQAARSVTDRLGKAASDIYEPIGNFFKGVKQGYNGKAQTATVARPDAPDQSDAETARLGRSGEVREDGKDPMDARHAVTDSYYESREGDAMLARIKSLALIK